MTPFIFSSLLGSISLSNISSGGVISRLQEGVGVTSAGVAVLPRAFIAVIAYTYWLELSRDKLSNPCLFSCRSEKICKTGSQFPAGRKARLTGFRFSAIDRILAHAAPPRERYRNPTQGHLAREGVHGQALSRSF